MSAPDLLDRWRVFGEACKDKRLNQSSLAVLWAIADRINDSGEAWPSLNRIAIDAGCDRRTAARAVGTLTETGWLRVTPGTRTSPNRYRIGRGEPAPSGKAAPSGELVALGRGELAQKVGANSPLKPTHRTYPLNLPKKRARAQSIEIPDWLPAESWEQWRKHKGSKFSQQAQQGALNKLAKLRDEGHCPAKVIAHSLEHGWQGVFADNRNGTTKVNGSRPGAIPIDHRTHDELAAANAAEARRMGLG